jgi:hypothetical protein
METKIAQLGNQWVQKRSVGGSDKRLKERVMLRKAQEVRRETNSKWKLVEECWCDEGCSHFLFVWFRAFFDYYYIY